MEIMEKKLALDDFKKKFELMLLSFLEKKEREAAKIDFSFVEAVRAIKKLIQAGGKRLRPFLLFLGYKTQKNKLKKEVWQAAMALELLHTFALIHDDIMDKSFKRRNRPSAWKEYGLEKAILIGDLAFALAEEIFFSVKSSKAQHYFNKLKLEVLAGQYLDIGRCQTLTEKKVMKIMDLKTARYSFSRPLQIGAALAQAKEFWQKKLFRLGRALGIAFQIQDDYLAIFGSERKMGKPKNLDIQQDKKTLFRATAEAKQIYGKIKNASPKKIQTIFKKYGIVQNCQEKIKEEINKAKKIIAELKLKKEIKAQFWHLVDFLEKRRN